MKPNNNDKNNLRNTLDDVLINKMHSKAAFALLLLLYAATTAAIRMIALGGANTYLMLIGRSVPIGGFTGIFSNLANICLVTLVVFFGKIGFVTALGLLLMQFSMIFLEMVTQHSTTYLPGVFGNALTILAIIIIYLKSAKVNEYQTRMREQAVTDRLTGLPNRFACSELLNELIRIGERFALVHIDINGFKSINSSMGYEAGNKVLIEIAQRWKDIADTGVSGTSDFITRVSGDEYVLIIRGYNSDEAIRKTISHYESALGKRLTIDNCDFFITASFGYAEYPSDASTTDSLFSYADTAIHEVKRLKNSNHILRFTPDLLKIERTIEIEGKIRDALENDTISFRLQPQFDMSHKLRGFEALARMRDSDGNIIAPSEFIPVAEKVGLIDKVDSAVFRKAAMFFGGLCKKTDTKLMLSVNASVRHLMKNGFLNEVRWVLSTSGLPPQQLEIEITESIMIDSAEKAFQCITEIRDMGVQIAIDDFGTGYSSLSYLNNFPANLLKIDKSFIDKMNSGDSSKQYVAAIISIGHIMGFDVISEGVEDPDQLETLKDIGCDLIQGFIWGRPLHKKDAEQLVMENLNS
ncbi:bifunctional diguanylate cyclase/phosphodiesterase [Ruminococcus flavefaciens]|uniref:putative bifunctional diguanylate cyclase/phosphodiesterase n=1 Tax=Ruminococcus flavefaciens TaxID=1265 RepID=UPI0026E962A1|nr:GGDEF domain-containing phosphodiesterase [Ruminococcus flavefaciens]